MFQMRDFRNDGFGFGVPDRVMHDGGAGHPERRRRRGAVTLVAAGAAAVACVVVANNVLSDGNKTYQERVEACTESLTGQPNIDLKTNPNSGELIIPASMYVEVVACERAGGDVQLARQYEPSIQRPLSATTSTVKP